MGKAGEGRADVKSGIHRCRWRGPATSALHGFRMTRLCAPSQLILKERAFPSLLP